MKKKLLLVICLISYVSTYAINMKKTTVSSANELITAISKKADTIIVKKRHIQRFQYKHQTWNKEYKAIGDNGRNSGKSSYNQQINNNNIHRHG